MAKRKETPDIMSEIFGEDAGKPAQQQDVTPAEQQASKPAEQYTSIPVYQRSLRDFPEKDKGKATFYLLPETIDELDEVWIKLRQMVGKIEPGQKSSASKSLIVEAALQLVFEELEKEGMESRLAKKITSFW